MKWKNFYYLCIDYDSKVGGHGTSSGREQEENKLYSKVERDEKDKYPCLGEELSVTQDEGRELLRKHVKVMSEIPGKMELVWHNVDVGGAKPI